MKTGFSQLEILHRENPVFITGMGLQCGLGNNGPQKVLNGTKLTLDDHGNNLDSFRISLESFRSFRGSLLQKPVNGQEIFLPFFTANFYSSCLMTTQ